MKKKIIGIFVCTLMIATTFPVVGILNEKIITPSSERREKNLTNTKFNNEWEPVVGTFIIDIGKFAPSPYPSVITKTISTHFEIRNWTAGIDHVVHINWTITNGCNINPNIIVGYRIREWQSDKLFPRFRFLYTNSGCISTPSEKKWFGSHIIKVKPFTNDEGQFNIIIHFDNPSSCVNMTDYLWIYVPPPALMYSPISRLKFDWSNQKIIFP